MIIEICPKCGSPLFTGIICTIPPIPKKRCFSCGWSWEGSMDKVTYKVFSPPEEGGMHEEQ